MDLSKHIEVRDFDDGLPEPMQIEQILAEVSGEQSSSVDQFPPWRVVTVPLPAQHGAETRFLVLFAYYHSHGDGKSGLAFHRTFFEGLNDSVASDIVADEDQPVGLLQYLEDFRPWTLGQIGKKLASSFEISNLVVFDPDLRSGQLARSILKSFLIESTMFAQPADTAGVSLNFNLVTTKSGPLVMTVTWQLGVLDVGDLKQEYGFVRDVCSRVEQSIGELAKAPM